MKEQIRNFIETEQLLAQGDRIIVGLSGGADSMCLLLCLLALKDAYDWKLTAVHVHHGIRGQEADRDAAYCRAFCEEHNVSFLLYREQVPKKAEAWHCSVEEAGRRVRYDCFLQAAKACGAGKICVAHHRDDAAETMLFRLLRGTGLHGLRGISAKSRPYKDSAVELVRPLLCVTREQILSELAADGIPYCTDETNADNTYDRNYIRNVLLPACRQVNDCSTEHLLQLRDQLMPVIELMDGMTEEAYGRLYQEESLDVKGTQALPAAIRREVLLRFLRELSGTAKDLTALHVQLTEEMLFADGPKELSLPYGLILVRDGARLRRKLQLEPYGEWPVQAFPCTFAGVKGYILSLSLEKYDKSEPIPKNKYTKWFDYGKIGEGISVRRRKPGDRMQISVKGQTKLVQNILTDAHMPQEYRDAWPMLAAAGEVLWIPGCRGSEGFRVDEDTDMLLRAEWRKQDISEKYREDEIQEV